MNRPLHFNAFVMATASHLQHGVWRHPDSAQSRFNEIATWIDLAQAVERAGFDAIFFADVIGLHNPSSVSPDEVVRHSVQVPALDPSIAIAALAAHTKRLGLALTSSILQAHPFEFACRMSTLDDVSGGRIAWNVVTSTQDNAARNFGFESLPEHDERYRWAEEYLEVVYKLWEGSWDDDALVRDRRTGEFARPSGVHRINHRGSRYSVEGPHLSAPTPNGHR